MTRCTEIMKEDSPLVPVDVKELQDEIATYGEGPAPDLDSDARLAWFESQVCHLGVPYPGVCCVLGPSCW